MGVAIGGFHDLVGHLPVGVGQFGELAADEALGGENGVGGVGNGLALGGLADEALPGFREGHDGGGRACSLRILENGRFPCFHDGHAGVGRSEIDS